MSTIFDEDENTGVDDARKLQLTLLCNILRKREGRDYFYQLIHSTGVLRNTHVDDKLNNAFENGRKAIGYSIIDDLKEADIDYFLMMIKENM